MQIGYSGGFAESVAQVQALEKAGMDIVYVAEAYGYDAPTLMGYLAAETETIQIASGILPIYTRTPTLLAMTAAGIDALSDGRCVLGLGASGPQVVEGWYGQPYSKPLARTREYVEIVRRVLARDEPLLRSLFALLVHAHYRTTPRDLERRARRNAAYVLGAACALSDCGDRGVWLCRLSSRASVLAVRCRTGRPDRRWFAHRGDFAPFGGRPSASG